MAPLNSRSNTETGPCFCQPRTGQLATSMMLTHAKAGGGGTRPEWHSEDDRRGAIKVVMTGSAADVPAWRPHIGNKARRDLLAKRVKDPADSLRLVIVRDMWLTGFDAPSMHTMYIDKPMRGHGLMQAIARVNRVFRDKPAGLVVDYIGIAQNLKKALGQYSASDAAETGIDEAQAVAVLLEKFDVVQAMFHGFDCMPGISGTPVARLKCLAEAIEFILARQHEAATKETNDEARKAAHRRFQDVVLALTKAFALAAASDEARAIRDEIAFYRTIRAALAKTGGGSGSTSDRDFAVQQLIDKSVVSTEIVDILRGRPNHARHLDPVRRLPRRGEGNGPAEPSAEEAARRPDPFAQPHQCGREPPLLRTLDRCHRSISHQRHQHGGGVADADRSGQADSR